MYWQRGRLLLGSKFDDVRVSNRCPAEINDAAVNVGKRSVAVIDQDRNRSFTGSRPRQPASAPIPARTSPGQPNDFTWSRAAALQNACHEAVCERPALCQATREGLHRAMPLASIETPLLAWLDLGETCGAQRPARALDGRGRVGLCWSNGARNTKSIAVSTSKRGFFCACCLSMGGCACP